MTAPSPGGVQRWRCYYLNDFNGDYDAASEHDPDGDWVRYGDHVDALIAKAIDTSPLFTAWGIERKLLEEANSEIARLRKALEAIAGHVVNTGYGSFTRDYKLLKGIATEALRGAAGEVK